MLHFYRNENHRTLEISGPEEANWINVTPPFEQNEIDNLSTALDIPRDFLTDTLDIEERSRFENADGVKMIIIKTPVENKSVSTSDAYYITIPIAIIITPKNQIVTVNSFDNAAIHLFLQSFAKRHPEKSNMMVLKIFEKVIWDYIHVLKDINNKRDQLEQELYDSNRNYELLQIMRVQKSLVYFVTALRSNELMMMKMERTNFLQCNEDELEFLSDLLVEFSQALEMANNYTNILSSTMDAFASIINNNMNIVMKRLTAITIILSVPNLVMAFFSMNVSFPMQNTVRGFYLAITLAIIISFFTALYFNKRRWF